MKVTIESFDKAGGISINFHTGHRTITGTRVGFKVRIAGKCKDCFKRRSITEEIYGYVNNGFNKKTEEEARADYLAQAKAMREALLSGESTRTCGCGGQII